jgi:SAM-dependent methyltransferase
MGRAPRLSTSNNRMNQEINSRVVGAAPAGTRDRESSARAVREMFTSIAPRYDLLNHVLSFNIDRLWWWRTARKFDAILRRPDARVLDLCCGTGDMTFALQAPRRLGSPQILGADFSHAMLQRAAAKAAQKGSGATLALDRSGRAPVAVSRWTFSSGDVGVRFSKPGRLRRGPA